MNPIETTSSSSLRQHSLFWLAAANSVGVLLALLLLWPDFGDRLAPLTYGRWIPLHLDWQLYGWCSLPLVGVLFRWIGDGETSLTAKINRFALWSWSLSLGAAGISWLSGLSSGKVFVDWQSWARPLLPSAMSLLWFALAWQFWVKRRKLPRIERILQAVFLLVLLAVPPALFWASSRNVYPPVNPHSGGATGASLLGSTLGIIAIYGLIPTLLGVPLRGTKTHRLRQFFWSMFAFSVLVFLLIGHGNDSNRETSQQIGLAVLILWIPLSWVYFTLYDWPLPARRWLIAAFFWWLLLVLSGFVFFLPGISERIKFTNALVAHAHLALAGFVSCFNIALLNALAPRRPVARGFWIWQGALFLHIAALFTLGWTEYGDPAGLFLDRNWPQFCYGLRLISGLAMWLLSLVWLFQKPRDNAAELSF